MKLLSNAPQYWVDEMGNTHPYQYPSDLSTMGVQGLRGGLHGRGLGCGGDMDCGCGCGMNGLGAMGCGCVPTPGCVDGLGANEAQPGSGAVKVLLLVLGVAMAWALTPHPPK